MLIILILMNFWHEILSRENHEKNLININFGLTLISRHSWTIDRFRMNIIFKIQAVLTNLAKFEDFLLLFILKIEFELQ